MQVVRVVYLKGDRLKGPPRLWTAPIYLRVLYSLKAHCPPLESLDTSVWPQLQLSQTLFNGHLPSDEVSMAIFSPRTAIVKRSSQEAS